MSTPKPADAPQRTRLPRAEREAQMLSVAARLFSTQGFEATSMDEIAQACGVTKPMLYAYFDSKQGLYQAMILRAGNHLLVLLMALQQEPDPEQRLRRSVRLLIDFVDRHRESWRMVFATDRQGLAAGSGGIAGYRKQILIALSMTLQQLRPPGVSSKVAEPIAEAYAHLLLGAAEGGAQWWLQSPDSSADAVITLSEQVLSGVLPVVRAAMLAAMHPSTPARQSTPDPSPAPSGA